MKLSVILLLVGTLQVSAFSYGQRITLHRTNGKLTTVLRELEKQSGYHIFFDKSLIPTNATVNISVKNALLDDILREMLIKHNLDYEKLDRNIVLVRRTLPKTAGNDARRESIIQEKIITGNIKNNVGEPLEGVTVSIKGTNTRTSTDGKGYYSIAVEDAQSIILISFVGYKDIQTTVGNRSVIDLAMEVKTDELDEVVVVGYGTVKKSDLTGSVSQVKAKELNAFPSANALQALAGRAPGVHIRQSSGAPGPSMSVRVRGGNSIQGSNEPLYVVDGFPIAGSNPTIVNPADIESVEILKDASATAIYGSRGANGVVLITTKKGKQGRTNVAFESSYTSQKLIRELDLMNAQEYARFYNEQAINDNLDPYFTEQEIEAFGQGFDWQDFVFQQAPVFTSSLNVSGGNEKTQFSLGGSFFGQDGIVKGSDYDRYSLQNNIKHKINDKVTVELNSTLSKLTTRRRDSQGGNRGNSMIAAAISAPPILTPFNEDGSYRVLHTAYPFLATDLRNPINWINESNSEIKANLALINASISYDITPDLTLKIAGGLESRDERTDNYTTTKFFDSPGNASVSTGQHSSLLNENTLNYTRTFNQKHSLAAVAGITYQNFTNTSVNASGSDFLSDIFGSHNLGAAGTPGVPGSAYIKSTLISFLGRVNYSYDDRFLATISLRRDGSSRYSSGSQWGNFPSGALAWRVSNEDFMKNLPIISELKLRTSWGLTGSQAIDPYTTLNLLSPGKTIFGNDYHNTVGPSTRLPNDLSWETTEQLDVGADIGVLNNRILFTADYYVKNTRDLLSDVRLPASMGYISTIQNVGKVQNKGFEFGVEAKPFTQAFTWDLQANISFNNNKVISLYNHEDVLRDNIGMIIISDATSILREGRPVGQFWGYIEDGYDNNGDIIFRDINGDGSISAADKTYIGDANPDFTYGLNSAMSYKNFEFSFFLQGTYGNDILNASSITNTMDYGFGLNMPKSVYENHWTANNPDADYPRISRSTPVKMSDRFIENGSYLRLKNISLAYNLPLSAMNVSKIQRLQVYVSGQNLFTATEYSWWDPETNFRLDHNSYPSAKSVTFGIRAGF
ncbi:TonB-dependent receptor [Sphingobacterium shayense]|uniref:TonB-dependent receptor n=1 Tax=Sphingobacterium shayense TaxID=626343 RepID=UPI001556E580|nr:TonB-dependent receptor [Sphingobacterium shayense]NQD72189.1 TonB-dependent receptor [Sphingobacterium shayense]